MKRCVVLLATLLACVPMMGQKKSSRDALRYGQMNEQGVWSVGVRMEPVVGMLHPLSRAWGGGTISSTGFLGFGIEGGYFVADNLRLSASLGFVGDSWTTMLRLNPYDGYYSLSQLKFKLGGHWHMARWDVGGGFALGNTTLNYMAANTAEGGVDDARFGSADLRDRHTTFGLFYEVGYMISPFLKASASWEPAIAFGGGYSHSLGARITIFMPFVNSVVCK